MDSFDRIVLGVMLGLVAAIGTVLAIGDRVGIRPIRLMPSPRSQPPVTTTISLTFAESMDPVSIEERFSISPEIIGAMAWSGQTLTFTPAAALTPEQTYTVSLEAGGVAQSGREMKRQAVWSFTPRQPGVMYLSPADGQIRALWYLPQDGSDPVEVYAPEHGMVDFEPSRDGTQVAFTANNQDQSSDVWVMNARGGDLRQVTDCAPGLCSGPVWSPDGQLLAYERREPSPNGQSGPARVWLFDLTSNETSPVFEDNQVLGFGPTWSPDGSRLAFFDANQQAIRVIDLATGQAEFIPSQMGEVGSFAPDSSTMAYVDIRAVGGQFFSEIWLADFGPDGGLSEFVEPAEEDRAPAWSPTGEWIAFARRRIDRQGGFGGQLYLMNVATGQARQITDDPNYNNTRFDWDPTGSKILVQRFNLSATYATIETWLDDLESGELSPLIDNGFDAQWIP
jgi:Tol biopolymer transport system component